MRSARILLALACLALLACQSEAEKAASHRARGDELLEEKKFDEAVIEFKNATKLDPNNADGHYGLARAHLGKQDARSAFWELEETVRLDPANVQARIEHGEFLVALGREEEFTRAIESGDAIIAAEPKRWEGYALKGRALAQLGRHEEAGAEFAKGVQIAPDQPVVVLLWARYLRGAGKVEEAEAQYKALAQLSPGFGTTAELGGFYAAIPGREAEAEATFRRALELAKDEELLNATRVLAEYLAYRGRPQEAEQVLQGAIEKAPSNTELIYALASFYQQHGRAAEANAMIERATTAAPDAPEPWLVLSAHRGKLNDLDGALEAAEKAIAVAPDNVLAKLRRAEVLVDIGARKADTALFERAAAIVDAVLEKDENHAEANFVKGKLELARQDLPAALAALRRSIDSRPDRAQTYFLSGTVKFLSGDRAGARGDAQEALARAPSFPEAAALLARAHASLGEHSLAIEAGRRALNLGAGNDIRIVIAQSQVQLGQMNEALAELGQIPAEQRGLDAHFAFGRVYMFLAGQLDAKSRRDGKNVSDPARQAEAVAAFASAREHLEAAAKLAPNHAEVLASLFLLDQRDGRIEQSLARVDAATKAQPKDSALARLAGDIAVRQGQLDRAEEHYRRAAEIDPNQLENYTRLAGLYSATNRSAEVVKTYELALERNPKSGRLHLILGMLKEGQGGSGIDAAITHYEKAIELEPELAAAKNNLAYWLAERGQDLDRALDLAQEAKATLSKDPRTNAASADTLGWVFYKKNLPEAAVNYLREAVGGFDPTIPSDRATRPLVRHHLALALAALDSKDEAAKEWRLALSEYAEVRGASKTPEPAWVKEAREGLAKSGA